MKSKILYITSLSGKRINRFMESAIVAAKQCGLHFDIACNMKNADIDGYQADCEKYEITAFNIPFHRNPLSFGNIVAYLKLKKLIRKNQYDVIHCNTPVGGLLGRLASRNIDECAIIYQAHGFHFWKGAPLKNWLFYYPVERHLAKYTDYFLTINNDDYILSQNFKIRKGGEFKLIHGVGINHIVPISLEEKRSLRKELGISDDVKIIISVGELNNNKNHSIIVEALSQINNTSLFCIICGEGKNRKNLTRLIKKKGLTERIKLLGFRSDVDKLLQISSLFVFPSFREGLPISLLEAIECHIPCAASRIRGVVDLLSNSKLLFSPKNSKELASIFDKLDDNQLLSNEIEKNSNYIQNYEFDNVVQELKYVYINAVKKYE